MQGDTLTGRRDERMKRATGLCVMTALALGGAGLVAGCAERGASDAGAAASSARGALSAPPASTLDAGSSGSLPPLEGSASVVDGGPALCGCKLCAPHSSDDACTTDAECAPKTPCHATECVARGRAAPTPSGMMCTQLFACGSVDANPCGCWQGKCALVPR